jgi:hypothetical protein
MEYDIIGDIHGNNDALNALLERLGYSHTSGSWSSPPGRMILFVGDFIDRGEGQMEVVSTARSLIDAGRAKAIMGNHELNAIAWHRRLRPDNEKNRKQHRAFLEQVEERSPRHAEIVEWFQTLPLWLDLPELRVVHACWDPDSLSFLDSQLSEARLSDEQIQRATTGASNTIRQDGTRGNEDAVFSAVETLLKGIEIDLPEGVSFLDKDRHKRSSVRVQWWKQQPATYADVSLATVDNPDAMHIPLPDGVLPGYDDHKPLFFGHYWRTGKPSLLSPKIACVDYSAGKGGPLVAYCWRGEETLSAEGFLSTQHESA